MNTKITRSTKKKKRKFGHTIELSNDNLNIIMSESNYKSLSINGHPHQQTFINFIVYNAHGDFCQRLCYSERTMEKVVEQVQNNCTIDDILIWKDFEEL